MTDKIEIVHDADGMVKRMRVNYPFAEMEVGDRFTLPAGHPGAKPMGKAKVPRATSAAYGYGSYHAIKFISSKHKDGSLSIWRTE